MSLEEYCNMWYNNYLSFLKGAAETANNEKRAAVHSGHRQRMRERFLNAPPSTFSDHELVELLLFYAAQRRNVNENAHEALQAAGSLDKLILGNEPVRFATPTLCESANELFGLCKRVYDGYMTDRSDCMLGMRCFNSCSDAGKYAAGLCAADSRDSAWLMVLDAKMSLKNCIRLPFKNPPADCFGELYRLASRCSATAAILVIKHTDGNPAFLRNEVVLARELRFAFEVTPIIFADVIVCCDGNYTNAVDCVFSLPEVCK